MTVAPAAGRALIAIALAVLAGGCSLPDQRIYNRVTYRLDSEGYLIGSGSSARAVPTYVVGNPFGIPQPQLANIVGVAMQSAYASRDVRFAVQEEEGLRKDVTMVVAFDPPPGTSAERMCRAPDRIPTAPSAGEIITAMSFCYGRDPMASILGRLDRRAGVGDKEFVVLIRDMTRRLFEAEAGQEIRH